MAKTIAAYGGGFKPPTAGHFEVVKTALEQNPEIDEFIIYVGGGERDGITQAEAILIWEIYQTYLPMKVKIEPSKAPIGDIVRLGKNNLQDTVYFVIGGREGREDDMKDIESRTKGIEDKYPNMKIKIIQTPDTGMSGTNARQAAKVSYEDFIKYLPTELTDEEKEEVYNIVKPAVKESLNENASYSSDIDYKEHIKELTKYMIEDGWNILPLPKVVFKHGDSENARDFFGKTAYYDPNTQTIVLYTEGRHPKDIVRSFSHEMVHHEQNLDGRLGDIQTTNTTEDDKLNDIEKEANLNGTMTFRNWTDSLQEKKKKDPFGLNAYARELAQGLEEEITQPKYIIYSDMDGVLTDFNTQFMKISDGIRPSEYERNVGKEGFWELIDNKGVGFWVGMPWMSDGKQYWDYIKEYNPILLSSPSRSKTSRLGKHLWVRNNIPGTKLILAQAKHKQNYARENRILIDDRPSNIKEWESQGGIGILHTSAANTIRQLKELGL